MPVEEVDGGEGRVMEVLVEEGAGAGGGAGLVRRRFKFRSKGSRGEAPRVMPDRAAPIVSSREVTS